MAIYGNRDCTVEPLEKLVQLDPEQTEYTILLVQTKQPLEDYGRSSSL